MLAAIDPASQVFWVTTLAIFVVYVLACHTNRWELYLTCALMFLIYCAQIWNFATILAILCLILGILSLFRTLWAYLSVVPKKKDKD